MRDMHVRAERPQLVDELDGGRALACGLELLVAVPLSVTPIGCGIRGKRGLMLACLDRRFRQVNMQSHVELTCNVGKIHERFRLQRVGRMRADADAWQPRVMHVPEIADQLGDALGFPIVVMPAHDLPIGDAMHALRGERAHGFRISDDIGCCGCAGFYHHARALI